MTTKYKARDIKVKGSIKASLEVSWNRGNKYAIIFLLSYANNWGTNSLQISRGCMYRRTFAELSKEELYALLKLRQQVFIIEQNSIYSDLDDCDQEAIHYLHVDQQDNLIAYGRYRKISHRDDMKNNDVNSDEVKIERVVLAAQARGLGLGKSLIVAMLGDIQGEYPLAKITLSSQLDASEFYQRLGFVEVGEGYDDGGIMHVGMVYQVR
jgi:ElaA protein